MELRKDNSDLIINLKNGELQSMELLFRRLYPQLCIFANKYLHNLQDSEDIVQEVFYKVWKNRFNLNENESVKSYLFTAVKNSCFSRLTHSRVKDDYARILFRIYSQSENGLIPFADPLITSELEKDFSDALKALPPECRKIFELSRVEGLKYHEIAERLNISIKTVETQMSRALARLRVELKDYLAIVVIAAFLK